MYTKRAIEDLEENAQLKGKQIKAEPFFEGFSIEKANQSGLPINQFIERLNINQVVSKPKMIAAIPTDEYELKRVYGNATPNSMNEINRIINNSDSLKPKNVTMNCKEKVDFIKEIKSSDSNLIVITIHSEMKGEQLIFFFLYRMSLY